MNQRNMSRLLLITVLVCAHALLISIFGLKEYFMVKQQIALPLLLLIGLAGCKSDKKNKKTQTQQTASIQLPIPDGRSASVVGDNDILSFFDEELDDYTFDNDDINLTTPNDTPSAIVSTDGHGEISWIETAHQENGLKTIYFGFNRYSVSQDQKTVVEADAALVKELLKDLDDTSTIMIEGHACHSAGSRSYNVFLSENRAKYIKDLFVSHGVNPSRLKIVGRGQEIPAVVDGKAVTGSRENQWPNRRVEIRLVETA
jgi:outer membrane protein OmpA-like peptidoglycan-associated protein